MLYTSDVEVCIRVTLKNSKRSTVFCTPLYFLFFCFTVYSIHFNSQGVLLLSSALSVAFGSNRPLILAFPWPSRSCASYSWQRRWSSLATSWILPFSEVSSPPPLYGTDSNISSFILFFAKLALCLYSSKHSSNFFIPSIYYA